MFKAAPQVEAVAKQVIKDWHPELAGHCLFMFVQEPKKTHGKTALAYIQKVSGLAAFLAMSDVRNMPKEFSPTPTFFLVSFWEQAWAALSPEQRVALVDHELCHAVLTEDDKGPQLTMVGHDIEEFNDVVKRHGAWMDDVSAFVDACTIGQLRLFESEQGAKNPP